MSRRNYAERCAQWAAGRQYAHELPEQFRAVLYAHYEEGKSLAEIAAMHHRSLSTIRHHHDYGLLLLRRLYSIGEHLNRLENSSEKLLT